MDPEISRFCADVGYVRDQSFGTFPGFRLIGPRVPITAIEIEFAAEKFAGEMYVFTPDTLFFPFTPAHIGVRDGMYIDMMAHCA